MFIFLVSSFLSFLYSFFFLPVILRGLPITAAARSKAAVLNLCEAAARQLRNAGLRNNHLRPLEHWDRGFESHSRHGCLYAFILCLGRDLATG
jgi:hypothetical protein